MKTLLSGKFFNLIEFTFDEENPEKLRAILQINPEHEIFQGHFPENPIVPGVCIIQMIKETLSHHFNKELILIKADEVKFLNIIRPQENHDIELEIKIKHPGDELVHASVIVKCEDQVFTKFRGSFK